MRHLDSQIIHAVDYDDVLDILAVLHTKICIGIEDSYVIGFYDNQNGKLVSEVYLKEKVSDGHLWNSYMSQFVVICVMGLVGYCGKSKYFIYQLVHDKY